MSQTVVGLFASETEAQHALQLFLQSGFRDEQIKIANSGYQNDAGTTDNGMSRFFRSLLGNTNDERVDTEKNKKTNWTVSVYKTDSNVEEQIIKLLESCGAIDITIKDRSIETDPGFQRNPIPFKHDYPSDTGKETPEIATIDMPESPDAPNEIENFQEMVIELIERAEIPVIGKEARIVEEVRVSKSMNTYNRTSRSNSNDRTSMEETNTTANREDFISGPS